MSGICVPGWLGLALSVVVTGLSAAGCGGSGSGGVLPDPVAANFIGSGTAPAPDLVRLSGSASGDTATLGVIIGGPTTSNDLYSAAFDLVLGDPSVVEYVNGSVTLGGALSPSGGQQSEALASQSGNRVTVGVTKLGGGSGSGVSTGQATLVTLRFRVRRAGMSTIALDGSPPRAPAALDSAGAIVGSVQFDLAPATLQGN